MTISSTTIKNSYAGNGSTTAFTFSYYIISEDDLEVIIRASDGVETLQTLTTNYTVTGVQNNSGGTVTMVTAPATGQTLVIRRKTSQVQDTDYVANDPFPAETHEAALDKAMLVSQELQEQVDRSIKISRTNTMTSTDFTVGAADRALKVLSFDANGEIAVTQELGTYKGDWSASTFYAIRDLVKDTSTGNIFFCNTAHTSSGVQPLTTNSDSAKWDLIVDAAAATSSANAAASSATAAAASATAAASSATDAQTAQTAAELAETNAETAQAAAETAETNAQTSETNAATSASTASTQATNASNSASAAATSATNSANSATASANSATSAAGSASTATTQASNASTSASNAATSASNAATSESNASTSETNAATSASNASTSETNAATSASNASTSATNAANSAAAAEATFDLFDDSYLGAKASNPTLDNDGNALQDGALYFDTTNNVMKVYDLATTTWLQLTPTASNQTNINTVAGISSDVSTVAGISSDVTTTAGISSNISTVAGISSNVTTVAGDTTNIGTIATNLTGTDTIGTVAANISNVNAVGGISANVTTVAGISSDVTAVASDATDIGTVATNIANVNSVGGSIANVNTVASNIVGVNSFAERYRVESSDPSTSLDAGDLVFNTTASALKYYDGSAWQQIVAGSLTDIVQDGTPQLGGNLDLNSNNITGTGNIDITGSGTFSGNLTVDTNTLYVDSTNNRVGIGTTSPTRNLHLVSGSSTNLELERTAVGSESKLVLSSATSFNAIYSRDGANSDKDLVLATGSTERMSVKETTVVVNDSGNDVDFRVESNNDTHALFVDGGSDVVFFGKSSSSLATAGLEQYLTGFAQQTRDNGLVKSFNRTSSHGDIVQYKKDGITVGSIGSVSGSPYFANNDGDGVVLQNNAFRPSTSSGANQDNVIDLGVSASRFNDAHFGGTVNAQLGVFGTDTGAVAYSNTGVTVDDGTATGRYGFTHFGATNRYVRIGVPNSSFAYFETNTTGGYNFDGKVLFSGSGTFNEGSNDQDFRVESNNNTHMLFVDAGNDRVGIGTGSPEGDFHVQGTEIKVKNSTSAFITIEAGSASYQSILQFSDGGASGALIYDHPTNRLNFKTNGSTKMYISSDGHLIPSATNTYDLGSSSAVWRNIYTSDFHMSNEGLEKGNDIDGTKGSWTFQEGEENLYLINNKNGKKYKFNLTEIE